MMSINLNDIAIMMSINLNNIAILNKGFDTAVLLV